MDTESNLLITFSWYDYTLFGSVLCLSTLIGVYFGFFGKKQNSANEYLLGGKTMKVFPIGMSLISSHISGILLLSVPADIYFYGTTFAWSLVALPIVAWVMPKIYMPVFYKMQLTSVYEYLEARFNSKIRVMSSLFFTISTFTYLPIVIYIPALAFSQATGIYVHYITPLVCSICIFYTTIGGLKAVVWTDTLQFGAMVGGIVAVMVVGIKAVGGFEPIYDLAKAGGRFDWETDLTLFKRDTILATTLGLTFNVMNNICVNQGTIQKFLSLSCMRDINFSLAIFLIGELLLKCSSFLIGLIMFARYYDCDPFTTEKVTKKDQILPYFIMDVAGDIPGLPGLFIAGIFSAALSTLSSVINSLAGIIYKDFISPFLSKDTTEKQVSNILKITVFIIGVTATGLVLVVERLGGLLELTIRLNGITAGALLGLFSFGMLVPLADSKGALSGSISSVIFMTIMFVGNYFYQIQGLLQDEKKPLNIDNCPANTTIISATQTNVEIKDGPFILFKTSHYYYAFIGCLIVFIVGFPVSWYNSRGKENLVNPDLISPISHPFLSKKIKEKSIYYSVDVALKMMDKEIK